MSDTTTSAARGGRIMAAATLVAAAALAVATSQIQYSFSSDPLGPRFFPYLLAIAIAICAIWYWLSPGGAETPPDRPGMIHLGAVAALSLVCVALMPSLGFLIAMGLLASGVAYAFNAGPVFALVSGFGQALLWWVVFEKALGSNLPAGPLGI